MKKIEQITINGCCETTSIWLEMNQKDNSTQDEWFLVKEIRMHSL